MVLSKSQAMDKFKTLTGIHAADRDRADQKMKVFSAQDLLKIAMGSSASSSSSTPASDGRRPIVVDSEEESSDDEAEHGRPSSLFLAMRASAAPKAKTVASAKAAASPQPSRVVSASSSGGLNNVVTNAAVTASSPSAAVGAVDSGQQLRAVTNTVSDGRFNRLRESVKAEIVKHEEAIPSIQLHLLKDTENVLGQSSAFIQDIRNVIKKITPLIAGVRCTLSRIDRSINASALEDEKNSCNTLLDTLSTTMDLLKTISSSQPSNAQVVDAFTKTLDKNISLSSTFLIILWNNECSQKIMFGQIEEAMLMLKKSSMQVKRVLDTGEDESKVVFVAVALVENTVMRLATAVKILDLQNKSMPQSLKLLADYLEHGVSVASDKDFLAFSLQFDLELFHVLVSCKTADVMLLKQKVEFARQIDSQEESSPLQTFLAEHDIGRALIDYAGKVLEKQQGEIQKAEITADLETSINEVEDQITLMEFSKMQPSMNALIDKIIKIGKEQPAMKQMMDKMHADVADRIAKAVQQAYFKSLMGMKRSFDNYLAGTMPFAELPQHLYGIYDISDYLPLSMPVEIKAAITEQEAMCAALDNLIIRAAFFLRPSDTEPTILESDVADKMSKPYFWDSLPAHVISSLELVFKTRKPSLAFLTFAGGESSLMSIFVNPFCTWADQKSCQFLSNIGNLFGDDYDMLPKGARLLEIQQKIQVAPPQSQHVLLAVVGILTEMEHMASLTCSSQPTVVTWLVYMFFEIGSQRNLSGFALRGSTCSG